VSSVTSQTAFAATGGAGLFRTVDGADAWSLVSRPFREADGVLYGPAPTSTLYFWGANAGLQRSDDDGESWDLVAGFAVSAFVLDPLGEQRMWLATFDGQVQLSQDGGEHWEPRATDLPTDTSPILLAIDPLTSSVLYIAYRDGRLYKTENEGVDWQPADNGLPSPDPQRPPEALAVHPYAPDVLLFSRPGTLAPVYRSLDGAESWTPIEAGFEDGDYVLDLAFSPHISGTVYASLSGQSALAVSANGGVTWTAAISQMDHSMTSLGLDPDNGNPIYLGGKSQGIWRSRDGGQSWWHAVEGLSGMLVEELAAAPSRPETVYTAADSGAYLSADAGHSWLHLEPIFAPSAVAVDPDDPGHSYFTSGSTVYRSTDGGRTWEANRVCLTCEVVLEALTVAPISSSVVYAGGYDAAAFAYDLDVGVVFKSEDHGENWTELSMGEPISTVSDIAVDPTNNLTVYVATGLRADPTVSNPGLGVFRSDDGGDSWQPAVGSMGHVAVLALAIHPHEPQTIFATSWLTSEGQMTVFRSYDGGDSWTAGDLRSEWPAWGTGLAIDPLRPDTVYAGTPAGLFRSVDQGTTWSRAAGDLGQVGIHRLGITSDADRTILYVATHGGLTSQLASGHSKASLVQAGVYQQTLDHRIRTSHYLPLVLRAE